jgi:hypothetical protein
MQEFKMVILYPAKKVNSLLPTEMYDYISNPNIVVTGYESEKFVLYIFLTIHEVNIYFFIDISLSCSQMSLHISLKV